MPQLGCCTTKKRAGREIKVQSGGYSGFRPKLLTASNAPAQYWCWIYRKHPVCDQITRIQENGRPINFAH